VYSHGSNEEAHSYSKERMNIENLQRLFGFSSCPEGQLRVFGVLLVPFFTFFAQLGVPGGFAVQLAIIDLKRD
jgi:hypothetical protein